MGIDCPDIRQIVHLGAPDDLETYIEETGRDGRDGNIIFARLLIVKRQNRFCEQSMLDYQQHLIKLIFTSAGLLNVCL